MAVKVDGAIIQIAAKVPPWVVDLIDAEARKAGITRYKWMQRMVADALGIDYPLKRSGADKAPWEG